MTIETNPKIKSLEELKQAVEKEHQDIVNHEVKKYILSIESSIRKELKKDITAKQFKFMLPMTLEPRNSEFHKHVSTKLLEVLQEMYIVYLPEDGPNIAELTLEAIKD